MADAATAFLVNHVVLQIEFQQYLRVEDELGDAPCPVVGYLVVR